jgi:hypothetical protein
MARNNKILLLKKSSTSSPAPSAGNLEYGELAINYHADVSTVYFKDSANAVKSIIGGNAATIDTATALAIALG